MNPRRSFITLALLLLLTGGMAWWHGGSPPHPTLDVSGWGGKAEHCALAIGVIGASILSLFANPLSGPVAIGAMSLGLIWMVATCE